MPTPPLKQKRGVKAVVKTLEAIAKEADEAKKECGHRGCTACKWNVRCAKAMRQAIKLLKGLE